ncbi:hypothetical protein C0991_007675 [Blastosporella zonata]|nr:hypothetical protein C0991_007675 [Blastosporella zonata]
MLETPSRVWRRIEAVEGRDMSSLPSLAGFEDESDGPELEGPSAERSDFDDDLNEFSSPITSTPAHASSHHTMASTIRPSSSTSSTARFASSIASRSTKSSSKSSSRGPLSSHGASPYSRKGHPDSFDISRIPSLPDISAEPWGGSDETTDEESSKDSVPDVYLPPAAHNEEEEAAELPFEEAFQHANQTGSPRYSSKSMSIDYGGTPKRNYDYSVSLKSEPKECRPAEKRNTYTHSIFVPD